MIWGNDALPDNLKGKRHDDYPWPFKYIPRAWTSFKVDWAPIVLFGNMTAKPQVCGFDAPDPVGKPGEWSLQGVKLFKSFPYLFMYYTFTTPLNWGWIGGIHHSFGMRFDTVDNYWQVFRFAITRNRN